MKLIILDFAKRWWLLLAAFTGLTLVTATLGYFAIFSIIALLALGQDMQRGLLTAVLPLPIARREQDRAWWFIGVALLPLVALLLSPLCALVYGSRWQPLPVHGDVWTTFFASWWVSLGYGALLFLLWTALPRTPPVTARERAVMTVTSLAWGASVFGSIWLPSFQRQWANQWHLHNGLLFAVVPILVIWSYLAAPRVAKKRLAGSAVRSNAVAKDANEKAGANSLTGMSMLVAKLLSSSVGLYLMVVAFTWLIAVVTGRFQAARLLQQTDQQTLMFVVLLNCGFIPNSLNLRVLRAMPMSTLRLTLLLLAVPAAIGFSSACIAAAVGAFGYPEMPLALNFAIKTTVVAALGGLTLAASLFLTSNSGFTMLLMFIVPAFVAFNLMPHTGPLAALALGIAGLTVAFIAVYRLLKRSSKPYLPRRLGGMQLGQCQTGQ